jgi:hypothetical protein
MTEQSVADGGCECPSKTGHDTRKTGVKSVNPSVSEQVINAKVVPLTPTAKPGMESLTPSPEAGLSLPSPTSTTILETVTPTICGLGASDAIPPMTQNTMPEPAENPAASAGITVNPRSLSGSANRSKELAKTLKTDELGLSLYQLQLETYKPAMDACKLYLETYGSQSPNFYMTKNKQVAAICQVQGLNDPGASRKQRIAIAACLEALHEVYMRGIEIGMTKEDIKQMCNQELDRIGNAFGLGNKKAVAARNKAQRKAA